MESYYIRYGEAGSLPIESSDLTAVSAEFYVAKPGQTYILKVTTPLVNGLGTFEFEEEDTRVPIGEYFYQVNVIDINGRPMKYPSPDEDCGGCDEEDFPKFIVGEALDETEVS